MRMKLTAYCFTALLIATGCKETCKEKIARIWSAGRKDLAEQKVVNKFTLQLSYVPSTVLMKDDSKPAERDTAFYYFKLQVVCPENNAQTTGDKTALYYGLDSLFATSETQPRLSPVLVEPVVTGSHKSFEYLLVFAKKDFKPGKQVKVIFFDRLFTNTKQVFVFDRIKIDEIETLQCYANEA